MSSVDYSKVSRWVDMNAARFRAHVPPTDNDAEWFRRNRRSRDGWPRTYRVRASVASDHWIFELGFAKPSGFLTIVRNYEFWRAIVAIDADTLGPVVDSDEYARMRLRRVPGVSLLNDPQAWSQ
jgi:hypothetical protein